MNKITSTLAGIAIVAAAGIVPAFAQGVLTTPPGTFTFANNAGAFTATSTAPVTYNPVGGTQTTANFSLMGTQIGTSSFFNSTSLTITPVGGSVFTEPTSIQFQVSTTPSGLTTINSTGAAPDGTAFNLAQPVPEASTVISFGALLALGGLAVLRRKSVKA